MLSSDSCVSAAPLSACRMPYGDHWYAQKPYKEQSRTHRGGVVGSLGKAAEVMGLTASRLLAIKVSATMSSARASTAPLLTCRMPHGIQWYAHNKEPYKEECRAGRAGVK